MECVKDFFNYQATTTIMGSRDATPEAFSQGLLSDGEAWMQMITSRNQTTHAYDEVIAEEIAKKIIIVHKPLFVHLQHRMQGLSDAD